METHAAARKRPGCSGLALSNPMFGGPRFAWILLVLCLGALVSCQSAAQRGAANQDPRKVAQSLVQIAGSPTQEPALRRQAILDLQKLPGRQRTAALKSLLQADRSSSTFRYTLESLAVWPQPLSGDIGKALYELLGGVPEEDERALAAALGRCQSGRLFRNINEVAARSSSDIARRRGAVRALGYHKTRDAAQTLVQILTQTKVSQLRPAAAEALATLSGLTEYGQDTEAWQAWWQRARQYSQDQWLAHLLNNHSRRAETLDTSHDQTQVQLIEVQRQLYLTTPEPQRLKLLGDMLGSPRSLAGTRLLALKLAVQRLMENQPISPEVRAILVGRLDDPVAQVRQEASTLLRDLADESGADAVARRLVSQSERDTGVLRAHLLVLARMPRERAVGPALRYLEDPQLCGEASAALTAAADAGMLSPEQATQAGRTVRRYVQGNAPPMAQLVELLGRVGNDSDWARIEQWLESDDEAIKLAAARAWAQSDRPLSILAQRADDPLIQPIVLVAASERGRDIQTIRLIIEHRPDQEQLAARWEQALIDMADRVDPIHGPEIEERLQKQGAAFALREQVLTAAIRPLLPEPGASVPLALVELLKLRAALWQAAGSPAQALADYQTIMDIQPGPDQDLQLHLVRGMLQAHFSLGDLNAAAGLAEQVLNPLNFVGDRKAMQTAVADQFLAAAQRSLAADNPQQARAVLQQLRPLTQRRISPDRHLAQQVEALAAKIDDAVERRGLPGPNRSTRPAAEPSGVPPLHDAEGESANRGEVSSSARRPLDDPGR